IGQDSPGIQDQAESSDQFGFSLASGDFDGDGFDDLAIGVPLEDIGQPVISNVGMVAVIYGSATGLSQRNQIWTQNTPGIQGEAESGDEFSWSLAANDYGNDGFDDLAVGVPFENVDPITDSG